MNKSNFKLLVIGAMATAMLASCNKNNGTESNAPENGFRATIEQPAGNGSRTHIDPDWANDASTDIMWTAQDLIKVANGQGTALNYQITEGENTANGTFYTGEPHETFFVPNYTAIYPASNAEGTANSISGTMATFNVPQTQTYKANSFAEKSMPMVAYSTDQTLAFKNVFGGICIPMVGNGLTVTRVVLTSASASEHLYGVFTADCTSATPAPTYVSGGGNSVILDCSATPVTLNATTPTYFCFMVPPASLVNGFTVEAYNGTSRIFNASTSANPNITRSVISKVSSSLEVIIEVPTVTTISPTFITTNSALGLGAVDNTPVTCGILYALASDLATPADDLVIGGTNVTNLSGTAGTRFDASLTGLAEDQIYYVRAYATNEVGTVSYGDPVPFATRYDYYSAANKGKSRSVFTVDANNTQVRFSMGNLQYIGSAGSGSAGDNNTGAYWKFADNQFDYFGSNGQGSAAIQQDRDLFGWGTSGINDYTPIATCWQPWSTSMYPQYNPYGAGNTNLNSNGGKADWGYNAISNGGNTVNGGWRTLQGGNFGEWDYLLNTRTCGYHRYAQVQLTLKGTSGMSYTTVNQVPACGRAVNGIIVFPDSYTWPAIVNALTTLDAGSEWGVNKLTEAQWSLLEQQGAVFLPAAGNRLGTSVNTSILFGYYWSYTYYNSEYAYSLYFASRGIVRPQYYNYRYYGSSVRLVCPAE